MSVASPVGTVTRRRTGPHSRRRTAPADAFFSNPGVRFAVTDVEIRPMTHKGMLFYGGVPKFDDYDQEYGWLIVTEEEGERMAANLGDHRAQLLVGHSANNVGANLKEAICTTYDFVLNTSHQLDAMRLGDVTFEPDDGDMARVTVEEVELSDIAVDRLWEYLTRRLPDR